jgi:ribose transport system ATP-binding protein
MPEELALQVSNLSKRFGGALALDRVALSVRRGEVHGLLGSNGSGKSTLIKVLAGFHTPEPGAEVRLYGHHAPLPIPGPTVRKLGLAFVHQHLGLIPSLSVTENLRLGDLATKSNWHIDWAAEFDAAAKVFARYNLQGKGNVFHAVTQNAHLVKRRTISQKPVAGNAPIGRLHANYTAQGGRLAH